MTMGWGPGSRVWRFDGIAFAISVLVACGLLAAGCGDRAEHAERENHASGAPRESGSESATITWPAPSAEHPPSNDPHFHPRDVTAPSGNFLVNPGFEQGISGWMWLEWSENWGPFEIASGQVATGRLAAHIPAHGSPGERPTRIFGVVQEIRSVKFPTRISGRYLVERWDTGVAKKAYVQVVLIAMIRAGQQPTMQLRYVLDGMNEAPYHMANARYIVVHPREAPPIGRWIDFSLDVPDDYRRFWGELPPDGTGYRVLFEARYDDKAPGESVALDVWYDDLFVGIP